MRNGENGVPPFQLPSNDFSDAIPNTTVEIRTVPCRVDLIDALRAMEHTYKPKLMVFVGPCLVRDESRFALIRTPLLFVVSDDAPTEYPSVSSDDFSGSKSMVNAIIEKGHRRIAVLTDNNANGKPNYQQRLAGYRASLSDHDIAFNPSFVHSLPVNFGDYLNSSEQLVKRHILPLVQCRASMLAPQPTALFVLSDFLALPTMRVLWNSDIRIPQELSLASYGGWVVTKFMPVSIQSWVQPVRDLLKATISAISCLLHDEPFPKTLTLSRTCTDGGHATAYAISTRRLVVPGYLRAGQSLCTPGRQSD
ncbi:MAG: substrate-binding domain-containing protein [Bifidobacterium mongoliense]